MRLLIVQDGPADSAFLAWRLRGDCHLVDVVTDGEQAIARAGGGGYDAILLDLAPPGRSGVALCECLREHDVDLPVMVVSEQSSAADRIRCLDCGADDYLVKPVVFDELLARLRAVARRRHPGRAAGSVAYGPILLDPAAQVAWVHGSPLALTATEYRLVLHLVRCAESVVTREQLSQHVWSAIGKSSNVVDVCVSTVRRKLRARYPSRLIVTVRGLGYMLKQDPSEAARSIG